MNIPVEALAWVQALGWSLLHFVWQGLLVGLLFAFARSLIARENSSLRYVAGLFFLAVLAVCPPLTLWILRPEGELVFSSLDTVAVSSQSIGTLGAALESGTALSELLPMLVMAWMLGVTFMVGRAFHQWRALDRIATTLAYRQADVEALLFSVAERFGGMHGTRILVSRFIDTPTLIGWFKPIILLPAAVAIRFPREQLELILAHELGHLRRYDHLVNLGQAVVETLLFYHPVVHWISREIRHEREICCDNLVLSLTDSEPHEYARTLAALEDVRQLSPQLAIAASGGMLLDRVRRIIGAAGPRSGNRHSLTIALGAVASCAVAISFAVLLPPSGEEQVAEAFDQPALFDVSVSRASLALIQDEQLKPSLVFEAIQPPTIAIPVPPAQIEVNAVETPVIAAESQSRSGVPAIASMPAVATRSIDPSGTEPLALPEVADVQADASPLALAATRAEPVATNSPVLVHKVAPDYPDNGRDGSRARVGFEFSIDRAGLVRNIRSVSGDTQSAFAVAARNALRQWKFDPQSIAADNDKNYRQDFEFVSAARASEADGNCITPTGSHLCRPGRGVGLAFKAEEKAATVSQSDGIATLDVENDGACNSHTGSRVCRPGGNDNMAMKAELRKETSAQVVVLAGGLH